MKTSSGRKEESLATGQFAKGIFKALATIGVSLTFAFFTFGVGTASADVAIAVPDYEPEARAQGLVTGQYIVVFHKDVRNAQGLASSLARQHGFSIQFSYQYALKGFSASMPRAAAEVLSNNPNVAYVEQDRYAYPATSEIRIFLPAGVLRINADASPQWDVAGTFDDINGRGNHLETGVPVDVDIAIIDTGVADDLDLDIVGKTDCSGGNPRRGRCKDGSASDGVGHGSHVAGTAAASAFSQLIGVAPGARIWAVKVFRNDGVGYCSWAIAGVDWVTSHAVEIDVANMSLTCSGTSQALKDAIQASTDLGVTYVVAAGNDNEDAVNTSPANAPAAITVSAIADFDGVGGGASGVPSGCGPGEVDDTFTTFSNHGSVVDIAAPGACVGSLGNDGKLYWATGTSMAAPHVAGAVALIYAELYDPITGRPTAAEVRTELFARAIPWSDADGYDATNDNDNFREPLVNLATGPVNVRPTVAIAEPLDGSTVFGMSVPLSATAGDTDGTVAQVEFFVDGVSIIDPGNPDFTSPYSLLWDTTTAADAGHTLSATATDDMGGTGTHTITVTVDNVDDPPSVTLTNPVDGDSVNGTVAVTAAASDDGAVTQVEFFVGATSIGVDTTAPWSASWVTTDDGPYTVTAEATDDVGQLGSDSVNVSVNNTVSADVLYVYSMQFKKQGPNLNITIVIRSDTNGDEVGDETDAAAAGANIKSVLLTNTSTGQTWFATTTLDAESDGGANYKLIRAPSGTYQFGVIEVILGPHVWTPDTTDWDENHGTFPDM